MIYRPIYLPSFVILSNLRIWSAAHGQQKEFKATGCVRTSAQENQPSEKSRPVKVEKKQEPSHYGIKYAFRLNTKLDVKKSFCNSGLPRPLPHAQRFLSEPTSALSTRQ
jgi:hypothetical protein